VGPMDDGRTLKGLECSWGQLNNKKGPTTGDTILAYFVPRAIQWEFKTSGLIQVTSSWEPMKGGLLAGANAPTFPRNTASDDS